MRKLTEHDGDVIEAELGPGIDGGYVVRAVNAYAVMLNALRGAHQFSCGVWPGECKGECNIAQAIAKAEGAKTVEGG